MKKSFSKKQVIRRVLDILLILILAVGNPQAAFASPERYEFRALNDQLWFDECDVTGGDISGGGGGGPLQGNDNTEKVWNFLKSKGFSDEQAAGIMGNLAHESGDPTLTNTGAIEIGSGHGFGLAQWTNDPPGSDTGRRTELHKAAETQGKDVKDLQFQLDYLYEEMQTRTERDGGTKTEEQGMKEQATVEDATRYFVYNFERPGNEALKERTDYAKQYLARFGGSGGGSSGSGGGGNASSKIQQVIDESVADAKGKGVDLRVVVSGDATASGGEGGQIPSASVIKLLIAAALSEKKVPLNSVASDLKTMIDVSSNDAANRLINAAGGFGAINATASSLGADANIGRNLGISNIPTPDPNRISAQGSDTILNAIKSAEGGSGKISKEYADAIMSAMKGQTVNTKWGASGIPKDKMAHKTGELGGVQHDVGYFFKEDKWLAVSILTNNSSGNAEPGVTIVKETAKKIYDAWLNSGSGGSDRSDTVDECGNGGGGSDVQDAQCGEGGLIGTLRCYAWPDYRGNDVNPTKEYQERVIVPGTTPSHTQSDVYIGGTSHPGIDCGGFVTRLIVDSGFDPGYNYSGLKSKGAGNTVNQYAWAKENWTVLGQGNEINIADLRPGDVANDENNHTFIWIGPVDGFEPTNIASASWDTRAPMAGTESPTDPGMTWFGKR